MNQSNQLLHLPQAFDELFHAHKYGFHHGANCLVHKRRNGKDVIGFGHLQFEFIMKLDDVSVRLHMNRDVGVV